MNGSTATVKGVHLRLGGCKRALPRRQGRKRMCQMLMVCKLNLGRKMPAASHCSQSSHIGTSHSRKLPWPAQRSQEAAFALMRRSIPDPAKELMKYTYNQQITVVWSLLTDCAETVTSMHPTISTPPSGSIAPDEVGCRRRKECISAQGQCWLLQRSWVCIRDCYHFASHVIDKMMYEGTSQLKQHRKQCSSCPLKGLKAEGF